MAIEVDTAQGRRLVDWWHELWGSSFDAEHSSSIVEGPKIAISTEQWLGSW